MAVQILPVAGGKVVNIE